MNTVRAAAVRVMPPGTSSRNRLATPVTCRRCGMNTVRAAAVRVMPPGTSSRNRLATPVTCRRCGMKLCGFDVQPGHGGAKRSRRAGQARHQAVSFQL
jgi:ribosomal protein L37E